MAQEPFEQKDNSKKAGLSETPGDLAVGCNGDSGQENLQPFFLEGRFNLGLVLAPGVNHIPGGVSEGRTFGDIFQLSMGRIHPWNSPAR